MIFHIAKLKDWAARKENEYRCSSLLSEGFIHCSDLNQVVRVANFLFKNEASLVLLEIDELLLKSELRYEGETQELFPHIYGPINLDAIFAVHAFATNIDGVFCLPPSISK